MIVYSPLMPPALHGRQLDLYGTVENDEGGARQANIEVLVLIYFEDLSRLSSSRGPSFLIKLSYQTI